MRGTTHLAIGLLVALLFLLIFPAAGWLLLIPCVLFGSLLPDVDHEGSKINHLLPITRWVPWLFSHRGFFHSLFPPLLLLFGAMALGYPLIGFYVTIGYLSHLLSDMLTQAGIGPLHPILRFRIRGPLRTGGLVELLLAAILVLADAALIIRIL